jgi:hypothetical protein
MHYLLFILFMFGFCNAPAAAAGRNQAIELEIKQAKVGQSLILDFKGNKKAVHRWRLVKDRSRGLSLVEVDEMGWTLSTDAEASKHKARDTMRFFVLPKAPGEAELIFEHNYRSMRGGGYNFKYKTVRIVIVRD